MEQQPVVVGTKDIGLEAQEARGERALVGEVLELEVVEVLGGPPAVLQPCRKGARVDRRSEWRWTTSRASGKARRSLMD